MDFYRKWEVPRCRQEWNRLKADLALGRDMEGPLHRPEQLEIPASLIARRSKQDADIAFQERRLDETSKAKKINDTERSQILQELKRGFDDDLDVKTFSREAHLSLGANSFTATPSPRKELRDILVGRTLVAAVAALASGAASADGGPASPSSAVAVTPGSGSAPPLARALDMDAVKFDARGIRSHRANAKRTAEITLIALKDSLVSAVLERKRTHGSSTSMLTKLKLSATAYKDLQDNSGERVLLAEAFLGQSVTAHEKEETPIFTPVPALEQLWSALPVAPDPNQVDKSPVAEPNVDKAALDSRADVHDNFLKQKLEGLKFVPIESTELPSFTSLEAKAEEIAHVETVVAVEALLKVLTNSKTLVGQLAKSLKVASHDLKKTYLSDEREAKKKEEALAKQSADARSKEKDEKERQERRRLVSAKDLGSFKLKFVGAGFAEMKAITQEEWQEKKGNPDFFKFPRLSKSVEAFSKIKAMESVEGDTSSEAKLAKTMARWTRDFAASEECQKIGKVVAPVFEAMGLPACEAAFLTIVATEDRVESKVPSLASVANQVVFYGSDAGAVHFCPEPKFLGSVRVQIAGVVKFMIVTASSMQGFYAGRDKPATWDDYRDFLRNLSEKELKTMHDKGLSFHHGTIEEGMALYVPPGAVLGTAMSSQSGEKDSALKLPFLPKACVDSACREFQALDAFSPPPADTQVVQVLKDTCSAQKHLG